MRQIFLDTETTGLYPAQGHRIIEIAAVEVINRRLTRNHFHVYLNPEREIDSAAQEVHGITLEFLQDKPLFADTVDEFLDFVSGAELIIHSQGDNHHAARAASAARKRLSHPLAEPSPLMQPTARPPTPASRTKPLTMTMSSPVIAIASRE